MHARNAYVPRTEVTPVVTIITTTNRSSVVRVDKSRNAGKKTTIKPDANALAIVANIPGPGVAARITIANKNPIDE